MEVILHRYKVNNGLCIINLTQQDTQPVLKSLHKSNIQAATNNVYSLSSKREIIAYYHKCILYPATSILIKSIKKGFFVVWPGLTIEAVTKYLPKLFATTQGHINQQMKNISSTKIKQENPSAKTITAQPSSPKKELFVITNK